MDKYTLYDDKQLLLLINSGDRYALEILYRKYYPYLYNYSIKIHKDKEVIQDCIHDLFLKLFTHKNLTSINNVTYYLSTSMRNLLYDKLRRDKTILYENTQDVPFDFIIEDESLTKLHLHSDEDLKAIRNMKNSYNTLGSKQKHILYLRFVMQLSYNEISGILNMEVQSAMNLLSRTLAKIRKDISGENKQKKISKV